MAEQVNITRPIKEGWLEKQSRYLKRWKRRWFVLQDNMLYSFKDAHVYKNPTEVIDLTVYSSVRSSEDSTNKLYAFDIYSRNHSFSLLACSDHEKEEWIRVVGKAIVISRPNPYDDHGDDDDDDDDD